MAIRRLPLYYRAAAIVATGGFLFGADTGTIGPVTAMKSFQEAFGPLTSAKHGFVVSSILLSGAISGLFAGNIADVYGRGIAFILGGIIFGIGAALEAGAQSLGMFIFGRVLAGFGEGIFLGNLTVYICEIAPARRRGPIASTVQFLVNTGLASGYFICYGTARLVNTSMSWRIPLMLQSILAFAFAGSCFLFVPPSPRWLQAKGRMDEARLTLEKLGLASTELEELAEETTAPVMEEAQAGLVNSLKSSMRDFTRVFRKDTRTQAGLACILMAFQQFSGIDGVMYYAPLLFQQAGLASEQASFLASGVSALVMLAVTLPATIYADHWGRRVSAITGGITLSGTMLLIGSLYAANAVHSDSGAGRWVVIVSIYLFAVFFCVTWAITFKIYASEIQPMSTRASASSLAQSANWLANWIVALTTPIFLAKSSFGAYFFFGFSSLFCLAVCVVAMPETKGKSLEAINQAFDHKSRSWSLGSLRQRKLTGRDDSREPSSAEDVHLTARPTLVS
ncbi:sugar transport protein [Microthyrium microscopicum]|uniref:Sugar transport protein n=1 Tax=Microthyrium microscopicum TaxID=703497 RepID=A0A6A6TTN8_9PEZI|nr:sugar transport protein [Microthyrium microscopicum]